LKKRFISSVIKLVSYSQNSQIQEFLHETRLVKSRFEILDKKIAKKPEFAQLTLDALSPVAPLRRVSPLENKIQKKDYSGIVGVLTLAGILLPEDLRDLKGAISQLAAKILPKGAKHKIEVKFPEFYKKYLTYKKILRPERISSSFFIFAWFLS